MPGTIAEWLGIGKEVATVADSVATGARDLITVIKDKVPPEMRGEIEKQQAVIDGELAKLKETGAQQIEQIVQNSVEQARNFALDYEGRADQIPKWLLVVRSVIRPLITLWTFGWFVTVCSIDLINTSKQTEDYELLLTRMPQGFWWIFGIILTFWFGGKVAERTAQTISNRPGPPE